MSTQPAFITGVGMVSAAGYDAAASCAAVRAVIANITETGFLVDGQPLYAAQIALPNDLRGHRKIHTLLGCAAAEALGEAGPAASPLIMIVAVAEPERPGALLPSDAVLLQGLATDLAVQLDHRSRVLRLGRWAGAAALDAARQELAGGGDRVLVVAYDSLLTGPTVSHLADQRRLLSERQPDGYIPGEAAAAIVISAVPAPGCVRVAGLGIGTEPVLRGSERRLRADGLCAAIRAAVAESGQSLAQVGWRIAGVRGDQYDFTEDASAIGRTLRQVRPRFDIWTSLDRLGEIGAAVLPALITIAVHAFRRQYAPGPSVLVHLGGDGGERMALILEHTESAWP